MFVKNPLFLIQIVQCILMDSVYSNGLNYHKACSKTSVARTLMARLPQLFRACLGVPWKKSNSCRFGIILADFLLYIEISVLSVFIRIALTRRF